MLRPDHRWHSSKINLQFCATMCVPLSRFLQVSGEKPVQAEDEAEFVDRIEELAIEARSTWWATLLLTSRAL